MDEFLQAKKAIRCGKACGEDGITPEFLKYAGLDDLVLGIANKAFSGSQIPERWATLVIVPVSKSGDLSNPNNYHFFGLETL